MWKSGDAQVNELYYVQSLRVTEIFHHFLNDDLYIIMKFIIINNMANCP